MQKRTGIATSPIMSRSLQCLFVDYSPEELEVSVFVSTGGLPVGFRLGAPSYSDELSGLGTFRVVASVLTTGFFFAVSFFVFMRFSSISVISLTENGSIW